MIQSIITAWNNISPVFLQEVVLTPPDPAGPRLRRQVLGISSVPTYTDTSWGEKIIPNSKNNFPRTVLPFSVLVPVRES